MTPAGRSGRPGPARCGVVADPGDPALPVVGQGKLSGVRKSRHARWRAAALVGVNLLIVAHAVHFVLAGRTISPVEPSESMYTLELGYVNAGVIFFAAALLATLLLGRFVCGWACHLIALQDLCAFLMKKLGVRPRPLRSRLLAAAPFVLAFYMFGWPSVRRLLGLAPPFPGFSNHLITDGFWDTFPGPWFAALTLLTCGFAAVYFLGAKGFCTYGCPYGALFGVMDRFAPGRIRVTEDCDQCGHCTATCTSNVRVHEEVRRHGMVVDAGCMKCTDCIDVCPKGALYFGFGRPAAFRGAARGPGSRRYPLGLGEEAMLGAVCLAATLAFRGLYDGPPLLMALGLAGITAFVTLELWHLVREPGVRVQNLVLKSAGRWSGAGRAFASLACVWLVFTAHSGFVQWHRALGGRELERTEASRADVLSGAFARKQYSSRHHEAARSAFRHFEIADRWGLVGVTEVKLGLAWGHLLRGEGAAAETALREAIALSPQQVPLRQDLLDLLLAQGRLPQAVEAYREKDALAALAPRERFDLAALLVQLERLEEAVREYRACVAAAPDSAEARYNLGGLLRRLGRNEEAAEQLRAARDLSPSDFDTHVELGLAEMASGHRAAAVEAFRQAIGIAPDHPEARLHLPQLIDGLERGTDAP